MRCRVTGYNLPNATLGIYNPIYHKCNHTTLCRTWMQCHKCSTAQAALVLVRCAERTGSSGAAQAAARASSSSNAWLRRASSAQSTASEEASAEVEEPAGCAGHRPQSGPLGTYLQRRARACRRVRARRRRARAAGTAAGGAACRAHHLKGGRERHGLFQLSQLVPHCGAGVNARREEVAGAARARRRRSGGLAG
jgi:hypothetical protein